MQKFIIYFALLSGLIAFTSDALAYSAGPPDGYAGNPPARLNCTACHSTYAVNSGQGQLAINDIPMEGYSPGETYRLSVEISDPVARIWGFQLTVLDQNNRRAGNIMVVDQQRTFISERQNQPQFLMHSGGGNYRNQANSATWEFEWEAPDGDAGPISFYVASNAGNNNGNESGDRIYAISNSIEFNEPPEPDDEFAISIAEGWNFISSPVIPTNPEVIELFSNLVQNNSLIILRDRLGRMYHPDSNVNQIGEWDFSQGYQIKLNQPDEVLFTGQFIDPDYIYNLTPDWNFISYSRLDTLNPQGLFDQLGDAFNLAKDELGNFAIRSFDYNGLRNIIPGKAVFIRVDQEVDFTWGIDNNDNLQDDPPLPNYFNDVVRTNNNMSVLVTSISGIDVQPGDEIAIMGSNGEVWGAGVYQDSVIGMPAWGNDDTTPEEDGFNSGDTLHFVLWSSETDEVHDLIITNILQGNSPTYESDELLALELEFQEEQAVISPDALPIAFNFNSIYPNPFNSTATVNFTLPQSGFTKISIWNTNGSIVSTLYEGNLNAGLQNFTFDAVNLPTGIYLIGINYQDKITYQRAVLIR